MTLLALVFLLGPMALLAAAGWHAMGRRSIAWWPLGGLAATSTLLWLIVVALYPHTTRCGASRGNGVCPNVYGFDPPQADGWLTWLLAAALLLPALWAGWRRAVPPLSAGTALVIGPVALAWWTTPRGDGDGLWTLIFWWMPLLGAASAGLVAIAERIGTARKAAPGRDADYLPASLSDRLAALAIDTALVGVPLIAPLTELSHAGREVLAAGLGATVATVYLAVAMAWKGATIGQHLVGLTVLRSDGQSRLSFRRAAVRNLVVAVEVIVAPTLILAIPAVAELLAVRQTGRSLTDRLFGTMVFSRRWATTEARTPELVP